MLRLFYTFTLLLLTTCLLTGQSVWTGAVDSDWNNAANWSGGVPTTGSQVTISASDNTPVYGGASVMNLNLTVTNQIIFNDFVFNTGEVVVFASGKIVNNGLFVNANNTTLDVDGRFENNGTFDNYGFLDLAASSSFLNATGKRFNNHNQMVAFGPVTNSGTFVNYGDMNIVKGFDNSGRFNNRGKYESQFGSVTENRAGSITEVYEFSSYSVNGIYNNVGITNTRGDFIIQNAGVFNNDNDLRNRTRGNLTIAGKLINNKLFRAFGPVLIASAGTLENSDNVNNRFSDIEVEICGSIIQLSTRAITGSIQNNGNVYEINGTVNETTLEFGLSFTDLSEQPGPVPACKKDAFLQLDESGIVTFTAFDIEQGRSYGSCGVPIVETTVTPNSFTAEDAGTQIVTITVTDANGNSSSCNDFVTVLPYTPPIVPVDNENIDFACVEDIVVTTQPGGKFAAASFTLPTATANCNPGGEAILCNDIGNIDNAYLLGQVGFSSYYVTNYTATYQEAMEIAEANGGQLVTINNEEENQFLIDRLGENGSVWIGLSRLGNSNNFSWLSGTPLDYTKWQPGEPNSSASEAGTRLKLSNGLWTDRPVGNRFRFVIEFTCVPNRGGYTYIGAHDGSIYYQSDFHNNWVGARDNALSLGGNLVTIDDQDENDFIQAAINPNSGSVWTGYVNNDNGNNFVWMSGAPNSYENWKAREPNGTHNHVAARLIKSSGQWTDRNVNSSVFEFVVEISAPGIFSNSTNGAESPAVVRQVAGPDSGGNFPIGETPILIEISDDCGNVEICEFNVVVEEVPADFEITNCPEDFTVVTEPGATTAIATFDEPNGSSTCFRGGPVSVVQNLGLESGEAFPIGANQITYAAFDSCGNFAGCSFIVNVIETPAVISYDCPSEIFLQANENGTGRPTWTAPTAATDCFSGGLSVRQIAGPASGDVLSAGTYQVLYLLSDNCNNTEICAFDIIISDCMDGDRDGVCFEDDCDDTNPNVPAAPGTACNDGNPNTENDVILADGCSCLGAPIGDPDCANITIAPGNTDVEISGLNGAPITQVQIIDNAFAQVYGCFGNCAPVETIDLAAGDYTVIVTYRTGDFTEICREEMSISIAATTFSIAPESEYLHLFTRKENGAVSINWVSNSEYRNDYFIIERSSDGINFEEIKTVEAFGYASQEATQYTDIDEQPVLGEGFYRVRQIFEDGSFGYSNVQKVNFDIDLAKVGVFPNPTETTVNLSLVSFAGRRAAIKIYNPLGVLMEGVDLAEVTAAPVRFDVSSYDAGLYTISIKIDDKKLINKRFVKIKD